MPVELGSHDRLDIQHYALREAFGVNYLAPIQRAAWVLDVGCGSGQWAFDICSEFPKALVVGLDLVPSKPEQPKNYRFVTSNLLDGLPFPDDRDSSSCTSAYWGRGCR